jgi:hypothetical protein
VRRFRRPIPSLTDVQPSADEQLRRRKRTYTVLMAVHLVGFGVGGSLYHVARTTGLVLIVATAALPWIAVIVANSLPPRTPSRRRPGPGTPPPRPLP